MIDPHRGLTVGARFNTEMFIAAGAEAGVDEAILLAAFNAFIAAFQSTNPEIAALKTSVAAAFGIDEADLGHDFGREHNMTGQQVNISIPQCVARGEWEGLSRPAGY